MLPRETEKVKEENEFILCYKFIEIVIIVKTWHKQ